jgi:hypothetical protein
MGVDIRVTLPPGATLRAAAEVIGIAAGLPWRKRPLGSSHPGFWGIAVDDLVVRGIEEIPECARIRWTAPAGWKAPGGVPAEGHVLWHHELENGGCGICPQSTAFWICVGRRLVDAFGGTLDYNDCDAVDVDYRRDPPACLGATDGKPWQALQARIAATPPITAEELREEAHAAYPVWA